MQSGQQSDIDIRSFPAKDENESTDRDISPDENASQLSEVASASSTSVIASEITRKKESWVWTYFKKSDCKPMVICQFTCQDTGKICGREYTWSKRGKSSTGTLSLHLLRVHHISNNGGKVEVSSTQTRSLDRMVGIKKIARETLKEALVDLIVDAELPYFFVENKKFIALLTFLNDQVPSIMVNADTIRNSVTETFITMKNRIATMLQQLDSEISITCDIWISSNSYALLGSTIHFIDVDWNLCQMVLDIQMLSGSHTSESIANMMKETLEEFGIHTKLLCITVDNSANNRTMAEALAKMLPNFSSENLLGCIAHVINLSAEEGLKAFGAPPGSQPLQASMQTSQPNSNATSVTSMVVPDEDPKTESIVKRIHKFVIFVKSSPQREESFRTAIMLEHGDNEKWNLILDVSTRWNSTYAMLERAYYLRDAINQYIQKENLPTLQKLALTAEEWETVNRFCQLLAPLAWAIEEMSNAQATIGYASKIYQFLMEKFTTVANSYDELHFKHIALAMKNKLQEYHDIYSTRRAYLCGEILDPRIKMGREIPGGIQFVEKKRRFEEICAKYEQCDVTTQADGSQSTVTNNTRTTIALDFETMFDGNLNVQSSGFGPELTLYLREPHFPKSTNPIEWWKLNQSRFPTLSQIAKSYLAVSPSCVPSERLFSSGGRIVDDARGLLDAPQIRSLMCLKNWIGQGQEEQFLSNF